MIQDSDIFLANSTVFSVVDLSIACEDNRTRRRRRGDGDGLRGFSICMAGWRRVLARPVCPTFAIP
jgi:hypothetical protein